VVRKKKKKKQQKQHQRLSPYGGLSMSGGAAAVSSPPLSSRRPHSSPGVRLPLGPQSSTCSFDDDAVSDCSSALNNKKSKGMTSACGSHGSRVKLRKKARCGSSIGSVVAKDMQGRLKELADAHHNSNRIRSELDELEARRDELEMKKKAAQAVESEQTELRGAEELIDKPRVQYE